MLPVAGQPALVSFAGDFVLFAYLLALARFVTALAALDTGSSFEGMGAAREVSFASMAEPALFLVLVVLARATGSLSLSGMLGPGAGPGLARRRAGAAPRPPSPSSWWRWPRTPASRWTTPTPTSS